MLQVLLDRLFRHLPYRRAKVPSRTAVPTPVSLLQVWKFFKQLAHRSSLYTPHDLERLAGLPHQLPHPHPYFPRQLLVPVLGYPNKVVLNLRDRVTPLSVVHLQHLQRSILELKLTG